MDGFLSCQNNVIRGWLLKFLRNDWTDHGPTFIIERIRFLVTQRGAQGEVLVVNAVQRGGRREDRGSFALNYTTLPLLQTRSKGRLSSFWTRELPALWTYNS